MPNISSPSPTIFDLPTTDILGHHANMEARQQMPRGWSVVRVATMSMKLKAKSHGDE